MKRWIKNLLFLTGMVSVVLFMIPVHAQEFCGQLTVSSSNPAKVYNNKQFNNSIGNYPQGQSLDISRAIGDWVYIEWPGGAGWMHRYSFDEEAFEDVKGSCQNIIDGKPQQTYAVEGTERGSLQRLADGPRAFRVATKDDYSCVPPILIQKLNAMANMGWSVDLVSAYRSKADNKRRKGAPGSYHIPCRAVDFRVRNKTVDEVKKYLLSTWYGGLGLYCTGRFHIDNGPHRVWGGCAQSKDKSHYRSRKKPSTLPSDSGMPFTPSQR